MSEKGEGAGWCGFVTCLAVVAFAFLVGVGLTRDCKARNGDLARNTQRCDVDGQQLGCVRDTAWWDGSRCSCALPGGRRIEYRLSRGE